MKTKWYFEHVTLREVGGWGSNALFPSEAIIKEVKGKKIVNPDLCAIYSAEGWDGGLTFNEEVIEQMIKSLNT